MAGFPSKRLGVFLAEGDSLIFRSDSNGEDLEGFAGAGLYDSVCMQTFAVGMRNARRVQCGCVGRVVRQGVGCRATNSRLSPCKGLYDSTCVAVGSHLICGLVCLCVRARSRARRLAYKHKGRGCAAM